MPREPFLINPPKRKRLLRRTRFGSMNPFRRRRNPFGEEVMLVGLNPFKKRRSHMFGNPFRRKRRKNKVRSRRRRNAFLFNPVRRSRRRRNPVHRSRRRRNPMRRYRRNPITSFGSAMSYLPTVGGAIGGMIAVKTIPRLLGVTGLPYYGVQAAVVVGGGWGLQKVSSKVAEGFVIGSAATALYDVVKGFLGTTFSYLGLGDIDAYPLESDPAAAYNSLQDMAYQGYHDMM